MAKTIPQKPTKAQARIAKAQAEIMVESFDRMQYAKAVYDHQNETARDAIDRMQSVLIRQARRYVWVVVGENSKGKKERELAEIPKDAIWNNALYMAVEILKDLASMDIRVADFHFPTNRCAECGTEIRRKKGRA
jgi:hypothetical protein